MPDEFQPLSPLQQDYFAALGQEDDTYAYLGLDYVTAECGLADGPIQTFSVKRGATAEECWKEIQGLKEAIEDFMDFKDELPDIPTDEATQRRLAIFDERRERFKTAKETDIYLAFCDDCQEVDPPLCADEWHGGYTGEWDVFSNWREGDPQFQDVWERRKVPYAEAVARIKDMRPLPPPAKKPFTVDPFYKTRIDEILPKLVEFNDDSPHRVVVEQKRLRQELFELYGLLASKKLMALIGGHKPNYVGVSVEGKLCVLSIALCQYDDWDHWRNFLKEQGAVGNDKSFFWNLTGDPDFAYSIQQGFPIRLNEYDSHATGF